LRRVGRPALAEAIVAANTAIKEAARVTDEALEALEDMRADRDALDDALDLAAQSARAALAGRRVDAVKHAPYTTIFPAGIEYYTVAPLDAQVRRYGELRARVVEALPADDVVRVALVEALDRDLPAWGQASEAVDSARTTVELARSRQAAAVDAWVRQIERTYGALVEALGRTEARRLFPKRSGRDGTRTTPDAGDLS